MQQRTVGCLRNPPGFSGYTVKKVVEQPIAVFSQDRLRVELHSIDWVLEVLHRHNLAVLGCGRHLKRGGERTGCNGQRVVAGGHERSGKPGEETPSRVMNPRNLAVHRAAGTHDVAPIRRADTLVSETHAENGNPVAQSANHVSGNTGFCGRAWARGDDDVRRSHSLDLLE